MMHALYFKIPNVPLADDTRNDIFLIEVGRSIHGALGRHLRSLTAALYLSIY